MPTSCLVAIAVVRIAIRGHTATHPGAMQDQVTLGGTPLTVTSGAAGTRIPDSYHGDR